LALTLCQRTSGYHFPGPHAREEKREGGRNGGRGRREGREEGEREGEGDGVRRRKDGRGRQRNN